jgi:regulator of sigma E protease
VFSGLAYKNGRQINPVTTVGMVEDRGLPAVAAALKQIEPGSRITRINGDSMQSWDEIVTTIANTPAPEIRIEFANRGPVVLRIHPDALEERIKAAQALLPFRPPVVGQVLPDKPAARAGIQPGDTIVSIEAQPINQWYDLLQLVESSAGKQLNGVVSRGGQHISFAVRPYLDSVAGPDGKMRAVGRIGVMVGNDFTSEKLSPAQAVREGTSATLKASTQIVRTVRGLFSGRISGRTVGGPILIGQLAGESARLGLDTFLGFMALISINLAILNLLPVPVLDGGQFLFLLAEAVIRRPLPLKLRERLTTVGLVLIVLLMGLAFSNDLRRLFGG